MFNVQARATVRLLLLDLLACAVVLGSPQLFPFGKELDSSLTKGDDSVHAKICLTTTKNSFRIFNKQYRCLFVSHSHDHMHGAEVWVPFSTGV